MVEVKRSTALSSQSILAAEKEQRKRFHRDDPVKGLVHRCSHPERFLSPKNSVSSLSGITLTSIENSSNIIQCPV